MGYCLIAYDVQTNSVRQRLSKRLEKSGMRIQKSVFVANLSQSQMRDLENWAGKELEDSDSLLILPCCEACLAKARFAAEGFQDPSLALIV